jgi:hypothetical protein
MAGIALNLVLEKPGKAFAWGDIVKGDLKVTVAHDCSAAALMVVFYCKGLSESKNFTATTERENVEQKLFKGTWTAGSYNYPFEIVVPQGPFTYKGHIFDVSWHLGARARASGGEDVRTEMEITVLPGKKRSETEGTKTAGEVVHTETARSLKGFFAVSSVLVLVGLYGGWRNSPFSEGTDGGLFFFGGVIPMVLGLTLFFFSTWQALMNRRIRRVEVTLGSGVVRAGDKIPCSLTFYANLPFEVERVWAVLRAEEIVDFRHSSSKSSSKSRKHLLYETSHEFPLPGKHVPANVPFCAQGEVPVPENIPYSINLMESDQGMAVRWRLEFNLGMKKYPDWLHLEDITVVP